LVWPQNQRSKAAAISRPLITSNDYKISFQYEAGLLGLVLSIRYSSEFINENGRWGAAVKAASKSEEGLVAQGVEAS
jgi:hypothetical protein